MTNQPRVTVGLPVHNGEPYLADTISSILAQDFEDFELLIADNASTDGTREIVRSFAAVDPRVQLICNDTNRGAAQNYNRLVHAARGELFKWAGYDDLLEPSYLSRCVAVLDADAGAVLAYPETSIIDADGRWTGDYEESLVVDQEGPVHRVAALARRFNLCNACFGVMRRERMLTTGLIRPYVSSDVTFLAEMAVLGRFARAGDRLFRRRVHAGSSRQGHTSLAAVARWFDPASTRPPVAPRLYLTVKTVWALVVLPGPVSVRCGTPVVFAGVYGARRARIWLGQVKAGIKRRTVHRPEMIHLLEKQS